jgi:NAD(P)-dependent dehydrogenase (short-subunit alcohol dehydrogenase family)
MAEGLVEAGGKVYCLDRLPEPPQAFQEAQARLKSNHGAGLEYHNVDVTHEEAMRKCIADIAKTHQRLDGLIAGTDAFGSYWRPYTDHLLQQLPVSSK